MTMMIFERIVQISEVVEQILFGITVASVVRVLGLAAVDLRYSAGASDSFFNGTNFYGFRVNGGGGYNYGWLKATAEAGNSFTINSYGYNSTANTGAIAGQGNVVGVPDSGPGLVGLALLGAGAAGMRLLRMLRSKGR